MAPTPESSVTFKRFPGRPKKWNCPNSRRRTSHKAWYHYYGCWPPDGAEVDHVNGNDRDNRKENLRLADRHTNNYNKRAYSHNRSGEKGVCFVPQRGYYWVKVYSAGTRFQASASSFFSAVCAARLIRRLLHGEYSFEASRKVAA